MSYNSISFEDIKIGELFLHVAEPAYPEPVLVMGFVDWKHNELLADRYVQLYFSKRNVYTGDYDKYAFEHLTLITIQEYERKYGK
jgi:hypothetical protein